MKILKFIVSGFVEFYLWIKCSPVRNSLVMLSLILILTVCRFMMDTDFWIGLIGIVAAVGLYILIYKRLFVTILVITAFLLNPYSSKKVKACGGVIIGVMVLVVGGVVVYKTVKFCQKKFRKVPQTNAPPNEISYANTGCYTGTCTRLADLEEGTDYNRTYLEIIIENNHIVEINQLKDEDLYEWNDLKFDLHEFHGIDIFAGGGSQESFGLGGEHVESDVAIYTYDNGTGLRLWNTFDNEIILESSRNLIIWETEAKISMPSWRTLKVETSSDEPYMFYRIKPKPIVIDGWHMYNNVMWSKTNHGIFMDGNKIIK